MCGGAAGAGGGPPEDPVSGRRRGAGRGAATGHAPGAAQSGSRGQRPRVGRTLQNHSAAAAGDARRHRCETDLRSARFREQVQSFNFYLMSVFKIMFKSKTVLNQE